MITGVVRSGEGRIRFRVRGPRRREQLIEAVIDTGYTGSLTLPPAVITTLGLRWRSLDRFTLADGSQCLLDVYTAKVEWDGRLRTVLVDEADTEPLVGMRLLKGYELKMQVRARGNVSVQKLRPRSFRTLPHNLLACHEQARQTPSTMQRRY